MNINLFSNKINFSQDAHLVPSSSVSTYEGMLLNDMIYLLTAIGLSPGGSTHLHTNNT